MMKSRNFCLIANLLTQSPIKTNEGFIFFPLLIAIWKILMMAYGPLFSTVTDFFQIMTLHQSMTYMLSIVLVINSLICMGLKVSSAFCSCSENPEIQWRCIKLFISLDSDFQKHKVTISMSGSKEQNQC